jgi:hypothetical protein
MQKKLLILFLIFSKLGFNQTQAEFLVGNKNVFGLTLINEMFSDSSRLGFFNLTSFNGFYENVGNELVSSNQLIYALSKKIKFAAGGSFNGLMDFFPAAGFQFTHFSPRWLIIINPGLEFNRSVSSQNFAILEFRPRLNQKNNWYFKIQGLFIYNLNFSNHERSFIQFRAGISKQKLTYGLGLNKDFFGASYFSKINGGLFVKYLFH